MIAFPGMLLAPAHQAGIAVPAEAPKNIDEIRDTHPHFYVFCKMQLGRPMPSPTSAWSNARVVAAVPGDKIKLVSYADLVNAGFE